MKLCVSMICVLVMVSGLASAGSVWHVSAGASSGGDGTSWGSAFRDVQSGIDASDAGDEVWVRQGTYQPNIPVEGSESAGILLRDGVAIYGGFDGSETLRSQRESAVHLTTLSGASISVLHVIEAHGVGPGSVVDGFIIRDGYGGDGGFAGLGGAGGGMYLLDSSPTIVDCTIRNNVARIGSGVYVQDGSPVFDGCRFISNISARSGEGGGIYSTVSQGMPGQALSVYDSKFSFNSVDQGHWATGNGGGIYSSDRVVLTVIGTSFTSNSGWHNGTFGNAVVGGAIAALGDGAYIENCSFVNGYTNIGGGIYSAGDIEIVQSVFSGNRAVAAGTCGGFDCPSDVPDIASGFGGAIFVNGFATASIDQCTIVDNVSDKSGAGVVAGQGLIRNSVLWGNLSPQPCCGEDPLPVSRMQNEGADVEYSCMQGLLTAVPGEDPPNPNGFPGSHEENPMFVDATAGNYRLQTGSPAIDSASNALVQAGVVSDFEGLNRFVDDPNTPDTGPNLSPVVDMGAFEYQVEFVCTADLTGDGLLDFFDISFFLSAFAAGDAIADFSGDGVFDFFDISAFLNMFSAGCP